MTEKAVVKVTLNEATDPDLFAFIKQFDNERMRAGALRALARAALNGGGAKRVASGAPDEPVMRVPEPATLLRRTEAAAMVESDAAPFSPVDADAAAASQALESRAAGPTKSGTGRYTDAIADQFADF
ncbi:hypothetical protein AAGS40_29515 (plasmid) [Paraburkholderia sp. PREW-6R]|uniref:hypothetical protein n=1 Tax=Paraburkholderia sp. PREW-6R TaxID=3141544 RepID=UPI0031F50FEB